MGDGLLGLILTLYCLGAALVANPLDLGRVGFHIINGLTFRILAGPAGAQTIEDDVAGHIDIDGHIEFDVEFGQQLGQFFGLGDGTRKAVEQKALGTVRLLQPFFHNTHDQGIRHQITTLHEGLSLLTELAFRLNSAAQDIAGRDLDRAVECGQQLGNGAFSSAGGAQQNQFHYILLGIKINFSCSYCNILSLVFAYPET